MFCNWMNALKVFGLNFDWLGHPVIAHFERFRSMYDHFVNFCNLFICGCICYMLSVMIVKSSAYAVVVHVVDDVLKWYPKLFFSSHLRSGSMNMINKYGLRVPPYIVPRLISIGGVEPKWFLVKEMVEFLYILPTMLIVSIGYPRSSMRASSIAWSMDPKALRKSM